MDGDGEHAGLPGSGRAPAFPVEHARVVIYFFAILESHFASQTPFSRMYFARPGWTGTRSTAAVTPRFWKPGISFAIWAKLASALASVATFFSITLSIWYTSSSGTSRPTWKP